MEKGVHQAQGATPPHHTPHRPHTNSAPHTPADTCRSIGWYYRPPAPVRPKPTNLRLPLLPALGGTPHPMCSAPNSAPNLLNTVTKHPPPQTCPAGCCLAAHQLCFTRIVCQAQPTIQYGATGHHAPSQSLHPCTAEAHSCNIVCTVTCTRQRLTARHNTTQAPTPRTQR